jgi:radical SAM superfamily enzyme YgiQ (UPF0313 family)
MLKQIGCQARIYNDISEKIVPGNVDEDIILISIMTSTARRGYEIARLFPDRRVIIGGVHASILPGEAIQFADQVVVGECERVLPDLLASRIKDRIVYAEPLSDLDNVPHIDYSFLKVLPETLPLQTSRGCPISCNFCSVSKVYGRKYRFRSPANVLNELLSYRERYGEIKKIDYRLDANFSCNRERAKEILRRMISEGIKPKVTAAHTRLDAYKDRELLLLMSQLNFTVCIGIESLNQDVLDDYNKKQKVSDIREAIQVFHNHNIRVHGYFMFGADDDEPDVLKQYADFADESNLDTFHVAVLTPHPGTELYNRLVSQKRIFTFNWDYYDGIHVTFEPARMNAYEMQKAFNDFYLKEFSLRSRLNPKLLFNLGSLPHKFFIGLMVSILKKDMLGYANSLRERASYRIKQNSIRGMDSA